MKKKLKQKKRKRGKRWLALASVACPDKLLIRISNRILWRRELPFCSAHRTEIDGWQMTYQTTSGHTTV
jgi:hypothetical protein